MSPLHMSRVPPIFSYSLPSGTCQCCSRGQTEWESDGRNQHWFPHWLCLFLFIPLGTLRFVCFFFFFSHFLPKNFAATCKGDNPALLGKGELGGSLKMLKTLCSPKCLLKKSQIAQLQCWLCKRICTLQVQNTFPLSLPELQYCPQCTNSSPTR